MPELSRGRPLGCGRARQKRRPLTLCTASIVIALCAAAASAQARAPREAEGELGTVALSELSPQAQDTLRQARAGGPFAYPKDGAVFANRERLLPRHPRGYYREYTVPTPGLSDRGPRRIITGRKGEAYYTDDHYRHFRRILE